MPDAYEFLSTDIHIYIYIGFAIGNNLFWNLGKECLKRKELHCLMGTSVTGQDAVARDHRDKGCS